MKIFYEKRENRLHFNIPKTLVFEAHLHESVEIIYMLQGSAHAFSGGKDFTLSPGDFFIVFPNEVHYYDNCVDERSIVIIPPMDIIPEFRSIFLNKSPISPHVQNVNPLAGKLLFEALNYNGDFRSEAVRGMLVSAVAMILEKVSLTDRKSGDESTLGAILEFCENNYKEEISLDLVSRNLNVSKSYISHIFADKIHMNFRDYINSLRISYSLPLLKQSKLSVTEIAAEAGFETIRTFNRAFKKRLGISPTEYKKQIF